MPRVAFEFEEVAYLQLELLAKQTGQQIGEVIRDSLALTNVLTEQAKSGFTEIRVRNPGTSDTRLLYVPHIHGDYQRWQFLQSDIGKRLHATVTRALNNALKRL